MGDSNPVPPIRAERKGRGWIVAAMANKLYDAADDPQRDIPDLESIRHNIFRWESGGGGVSERYRYLYCRAFGRTESELFGIEPKRKLCEEMRGAGLDYRQIATEFSRVYRLRPRAAWREASGWSLPDYLRPHRRHPRAGAAGKGIGWRDGRRGRPPRSREDHRRRRGPDRLQPARCRPAVRAILHFLPDEDDPHGAVRSLTEALVPGSAVAISHITGEGTEPDKGLAAQQVCQGASAPAISRSRQDITRLFDGLNLIDPGLTDINFWPAR